MADNISQALAAAHEAAIDRLSADELVEYQKYVRSGRPSLSPVTNQKLYEMFLHGVTIEQMVALNPDLGAGLILKARVDGRWDERREQHIGELLADTNTRLRQTAAESVNFMSLLLTVAHKEHSQKLLRYLQTGDPADLGGFSIQSFRGYKEVIQALTTLVGGGKKDAALPPGQPPAPGGVEMNPSAPQQEQRWTPAEADAIRARLEEKRK